MKVVALGDFGSEEDVKSRGGRYCPRELVRDHVGKLCKSWKSQGRKEPVIALGLGDNFYPSGIRNGGTAQFREFVRTYQCLQIPFFMALGNHDHEGDVGKQIEFTRSSRNPPVPNWGGMRLWSMPARSYFFEIENTLFVVLDTESMDLESQIATIKGQVVNSTAKWKVVVAHHPLESDHRLRYDGVCGSALLAFVKEFAHVYISGHDHCVLVTEAVRYPDSVVAIEDDFVKGQRGPLQIISGSSGSPPWFWVPMFRNNRAVVRSAPKTLGFATLDITEESITIHSYEIDPRPSGQMKELNAVKMLPDRTFAVQDCGNGLGECFGASTFFRKSLTSLLHQIRKEENENHGELQFGEFHFKSDYFSMSSDPETEVDGSTMTEEDISAMFQSAMTFNNIQDAASIV